MKPPRRTKALNLDELVFAAGWQDYSAQSLHMMTDQRALEAMKRGPGTQFQTPTYVPSLINAALSIEMYFKCILQFDDGDFLAIHDLLDLYNDLKPARQSRLEYFYDASVKVNPVLAAVRARFGDRAVLGMTDLIARARNAFVDWRYFFSLPEQDRPLVHLQPLRDACRNVVMEIKPEWARAYEQFGPLPTFRFH